MTAIPSLSKGNWLHPAGIVSRGHETVNILLPGPEITPVPKVTAESAESLTTAFKSIVTREAKLKRSQFGFTGLIIKSPECLLLFT